MTTIKHPATLIHNGVVIAMAISFAAALGIIEQLTGLSFQRGAARARCNFYKGREYHRAVGDDYFAIVPTGSPTDRFHTEYNLQQGVTAEPWANDLVKKVNGMKLPNAVATYLVAAIHTGNWQRIRDIVAAHEITDWLMQCIDGFMVDDYNPTYPPQAHIGNYYTNVLTPKNLRALAACYMANKRAREAVAPTPAPKPVAPKPAAKQVALVTQGTVTRGIAEAVVRKVGNSWAIMF